MRYEGSSDQVQSNIPQLGTGAAKFLRIPVSVTRSSRTKTWGLLLGLWGGFEGRLQGLHGLGASDEGLIVKSGSVLRRPTTEKS